MPNNNKYETVAAVDLGSNSFHMIVATLDDMGTLSVIDRLRETVRLRSGLTKDMRLDDAAKARALKCLTQFGQRLSSLPTKAVRVVGTNTLRIIKNAESFIEEAEAVLGFPIEIISGQEEARLIYLGVAHGLAASEHTRLVIDIGGGSTEFILGEEKESRVRESLEMGCVSFTQRFFSNGRIIYTDIENAIAYAKLVLYPFMEQFQYGNWEHAVGCSGTIKSIRNIVQNAGWSHSGITLESLHKLKDSLLVTGTVEGLNLDGLSEDRAQILAGGLSILIASFELLKIEVMHISDHSLREGVLYDLVDRITDHDTREVTVHSMMNKWAVDGDHAKQVAKTVDYLVSGSRWGVENKQLILWAAKLHEIGLQVAHSKHHEHGAYILRNADLPGFSRREQLLLSELVLNQRRKLDNQTFLSLSNKEQKQIKKLSFILRLAVLLHRGRSEEQVPYFKIKTEKKSLFLVFPKQWLETHPLTHADLLREKKSCAKIGIKLNFS